MSFQKCLLLIFLTPSVLSLSLVKLNESQKVGLPSFMYSHFNISDVSGVADVMQNFFNNFKDSISVYVDSLSGSADVQGGGVETEGLRQESIESSKNLNQVREPVKEAAKQNVEMKKVEVQKPKVVESVQQKFKQEVNPKVASEGVKQIPKDVLKVVKTEQKSPNNEQKENNQNAKLPQKDTIVNSNKLNTDSNIENKITNAKSDKPLSDSDKSVDTKAGQNTNKKESVNKVEVKPTNQDSKAPTNPELFSEAAKQAASKLQTFLSNMDRSLDQHLQQVKPSDKVSQALNQYNAAVKSAEGSICVQLGGESQLEEVLKTCVDSVLQITKGELKKTVDAAMEKVKDLDYNLRLTSDLCSSLNEPPSEVCEEAKKKSLSSLNNAVSQVDIEKLSIQARAVESLGSCIEVKAENLISWAKQINDCEADGQEL